MPINPDIRDQAYQFFIEEAPELLQVIEAGLLTLRQEKNTAKVHSIMRAAHSIKGGAASVELEAIAALAHGLENIFKGLYSEDLEIDTDLESQLLQAFDCLRLPLMEQIATGGFDAQQAIAVATPIFAQIEERLGDALSAGDSYIPSSADLGVNMAQSIFQVDVAQGLEHLANVVANPQLYEVAGELRAQAEVFAGFAEFLNLPGFGAIAHTTLKAVNAHPERAVEITQLAIADFQLARFAVLAGDDTSSSISPSLALVALAESTTTTAADFTAIPAVESFAELEPSVEEIGDTFPSLEEIFGSEAATLFIHTSEVLSPAEALGYTQTADEGEELEETVTTALENGISDTDILIEADTDALTSTEIAEFVEVEALEEIFFLQEDVGSAAATPEIEVLTSSTSDSVDARSAIVPVTSISHSLQESWSEPIEPTEISETLEVTLQNIEQVFDKLPGIEDIYASPSPVNPRSSTAASSSPTPTDKASRTRSLSVRVDMERLGRMNNLVGELAINRNGLSLQNEQLQGSVRELLNRFSKVQTMVGGLRRLSDKMVADASVSSQWSQELKVGRFQELKVGRLQVESSHPQPSNVQPSTLVPDSSQFDSLELDSYGFLHTQLQELLEEMMQLEESVDDIVLFAKATDQTLERQRQMLTQMRDELMWARMLPIGEVLNRFPRMLRDWSTTYGKPVRLKLSGSGVLVDKAILEKLYDPLLHLIRNAFDHGIEPPQIRRQQRKPEQGRIEIRAYHRGSQTIIEVSDDGQGLNLERIRQRALELGLFSDEQVATTTNNRLFNLIFEPGFSTASQVSELSGRGVGLDVVRSQLRSLKGTIGVSSSPGIGTTFTLRLPLTLTIAKLLVCFSGSTALALPSDSIEEIIIPKPEQIKRSGTQQFLHWRGDIVPTYRLADLLDYSCPLPETPSSRALLALPTPEDWAPPMLVLRQENTFVALEVNRLVTEQELVIKPFGSAIAPPSCTYGCTILGDGSLVPVIDVAALLDELSAPTSAATSITTRFNVEGMAIDSAPNATLSASQTLTPSKMPVRAGLIGTNRNAPATEKPKPAPTVLVVDDAVALRRTLALSLERAGIRVLQARDGREALERLQQSSSVQLVICDIEMPNMNGFEFLSHRRQDSRISNIPVVMLTSRSNDKHRWLAMQLGANAYFTKPYLEQEFLGAIKEFMAHSTSESLPVPARI